MTKISDSIHKVSVEKWKEKHEKNNYSHAYQDCMQPYYIKTILEYLDNLQNEYKLLESRHSHIHSILNKIKDILHKDL